MRRSSLGVVLGLVACGGKDQADAKTYPNLELSTDRVQFGDVEFMQPVTKDVMVSNTGELPMGLGDILAQADGTEVNFTLEYDLDEIDCGDDGEAKAVAADSVAADEDTGDTGGWWNPGGGTEGPGSTDRVLEAGCSIPLHVTFSPNQPGHVLGAFTVWTADDTERHKYYRDPDELSKTLVLEGTGIRNEPNLVVEPRALDLGATWIDQPATGFFKLQNVGDGDLDVTDVRFDDTQCDLYFDVAWDPTLSPLEPDASMAVEVSLITTEWIDDVDCNLYIDSNDSHETALPVRITANREDSPFNHPPTVTLVEPAVGTIVESQSVQFIIDMSDPDQPADTLTCKIRSKVLHAGSTVTLMECPAPTESGYVEIGLPVEKLMPGVDTIMVEITDAFGAKAEATTTLIYLTSIPEGDDDGDGWGEPEDCNDADTTVYIEASELPDGLDNDCDFGSPPDAGTTSYDDDGDCYCEVAPCYGGLDVGCALVQGGDCDDANATTFPRAVDDPTAEFADLEDNDCDGLIDEGTQYADDDLDGYDEVNGDCSDADPTRSPGEDEICDTIDNDCNGIVDDWCVLESGRPVIVGPVQMERTDVAVGESVAVWVEAFDPDGQALSFEWTQDDALTSAGLQTITGNSRVVTFTAPSEIPSGATQAVYQLKVVASDGPNTAELSGGITVHEETVPLDDAAKAEQDKKGCSTAGGDTAGWAWLVLGALAWGRRRSV